MTKPTYDLCLLKVPVNDIGVSAAFYRDVLGFEEQFVAAEYGWAQFQSGGLMLALYKPGMGGGDAPVGVSTGFHLGLAGEAFDALSKKLLDRGALVEDRIHQGDDGSTFVDVRDPDGNVLKIMRV